MKLFLKYTLALTVCLSYLLVIGVWVIISDELHFCLYVTGTSLFLTLIYLSIYHRDFEKIYKTVAFKKFISHIISGGLILSSLGLVNFLAFKNPIQYDFSEFTRNSLSQESINILKSFHGEITFKLFARQTEQESYKKLFEIYRFTKNDIAIEYIDVDLNPSKLQQYLITKSPSLIIEAQQRMEKVETINEYNITNAISKILNPRKQKIAIYEGKIPGNTVFSQTGPEGYDKLMPFLKNKSAVLDFVDLSVVFKQSYDLLIIIAPRNDLSEEDGLILSKFQKNGGNLLIALDPSLKKDQYPNLRKWLFDKGIKISNDFVIDLNLHVEGSNGTVPIIQKTNANHLVVEGFKGPIFFPFVSSIEKNETEGDTGRFVSLLQSSLESSWAEKSQTELLENQYVFNNDEDTQGPITMAAIWEDVKGKKGSILALGNSTFLQNKYQGHGRNIDFFLNSVSYLSYQNYAITFDRAGVTDTPLFISHYQKNLAFYFSILFLPLVMFGSGAFIYKRKQYL